MIYEVRQHGETNWGAVDGYDPSEVARRHVQRVLTESCKYDESACVVHVREAGADAWTVFYVGVTIDVNTEADERDPRMGAVEAYMLDHGWMLDYRGWLWNVDVQGFGIQPESGMDDVWNCVACALFDGDEAAAKAAVDAHVVAS